MHPRRSPILMSVLTSVVCVLVASGCGGGATSRDVVAGLGTTTETAAAPVPGGGSSPGGELVEYSTCMRSHGVLGFPDPAAFGSSAGIRAAKGQMVRVSENEAPSATFQAAQRACARYYGPGTTTTRQVSPQVMERLLAVSRCMRSHGIPTFPDPNPVTGELTAPTGISRTSQQVIAALQACRSLGQAAGLGAPNTGQ